MHLFSLIHLGTCTKIQLLFSFTGLYGHSAVYYAGKRMILVFGGYRFRIDSVSASDALYSLDIDSNTWHLLQALPSNEVGLVSCKKKIVIGVIGPSCYVLSNGWSSQSDVNLTLMDPNLPRKPFKHVISCSIRDFWH